MVVIVFCGEKLFPPHSSPQNTRRNKKVKRGGRLRGEPPHICWVAPAALFPGKKPVAPALLKNPPPREKRLFAYWAFFLFLH
uniref:Uncharacterized protein n=1 Tax=Phaeodactylum tricornutum TaxID=2850 RepID=A0A172E713_PHATR|nr:hypothetical protein [Phaeodactylum tricornutum]